jgi:phosphate-selective porin OprO/OprP
MKGNSMGRKALGALMAGALIAVLAVGPVKADDKKTLEDRLKKLDRVTEMLEKFQKDNEDLRKQVQELKAAAATQGAVPLLKVAPAQESNPYLEEVRKRAADAAEKEKLTSIVDAYLKDKDAKKAADDKVKAKLKQDEGFEVGKMLDVKGKWTNSQLWFETEDKAFRFHMGGRTQLDYVAVHAPQKVMAPPAQAGIGKFDDAFDVRRGRLAAEGTLWEVFDFYCEYDFFSVNRSVPNGNVLPAAVGGTQALNNLQGTVTDRLNTPNVPVPTDLWFTWTKLPVIGNIRVGNQKQWFSFEHLTSSRWLDFMERSTAFDAFIDNGNNGFVPGISTFNTYLNDRLFAAAGVYKPNFRDVFGTNTGDGEFQYVTRIAGNPIYSDNGRCMLHLGMGYWHSTADDGVIRYRARPELRNGNFLIHNIISIIQLQAHDQDQIAPEFAMNYGPLNISGEYYGSWCTQRPGEQFQIVGNQTGNTLPAGSRGRLFYQGAYVTAGYFLTGEHRAYNMKTKAWDRQFTNEPAFLVDGADGYSFGRGAVEVLARYSWLDLSDKGVNGGIIHQMTLGLNWYLNPNAKIQVNYDLGYRNATQYAAGGVVPIGGLTARDGIFQEAGTRLAFDW